MRTLLLILPFLSSALCKVCLVTDFGAKGDNTTEDTTALQAALDACTPGTIVFSAPGKYLSRSLNLTGKADIELVIEAGATLVLWPDINTWNSSGVFSDFLFVGPFRPAAEAEEVPSSRSGTPQTSTWLPSASNVTIHGGGEIDGQGWRWWPYLKSRPRPFLISMVGVNGFTLSNLTLRDSPAWNTNLRGAFMSITHMTILSNVDSCNGWLEAPNTDAFNIGGHDIYLAHNYVHNGDDCIPVFAWNNEDSYNILAEYMECNCGTNGGVVVMGDDSCGGANASIYNVTFRHMVVNGTNEGAGVKICEPYMTPHGTISNITWENYTINVRAPGSACECAHCILFT